MAETPGGSVKAEGLYVFGLRPMLHRVARPNLFERVFRYYNEHGQTSVSMAPSRYRKGSL